MIRHAIEHLWDLFSTTEIDDRIMGVLRDNRPRLVVSIHFGHASGL